MHISVIVSEGDGGHPSIASGLAAGLENGRVVEEHRTFISLKPHKVSNFPSWIDARVARMGG
jgi:hypothetical protein